MDSSDECTSANGSTLDTDSLPFTRELQKKMSDKELRRCTPLELEAYYVRRARTIRELTRKEDGEMIESQPIMEENDEDLKYIMQFLKKIAILLFSTLAMLCFGKFVIWHYGKNDWLFSFRYSLSSKLIYGQLHMMLYIRHSNQESNLGREKNF